MENIKKNILDSTDLLKIDIEKISQIIEQHSLLGALGLLALLFISYTIFWIINKYVMSYHIKKLEQKESFYSKLIIKHRILQNLYKIVFPITFYLIVQVGGMSALLNLGFLSTAIQRAITIWLIIVTASLLIKIINMLNDIYKQSFKISSQIPIRGYLDFVKMAIWILGAIISLAVIMGTSPYGMLAGLGALSAVTLLIFKDTILGFVSNIQMSAYDIVRVGDWISIPSYNADGVVLDITLNTVQVRNFNKTISTVPSSEILAKGITNWRGMFESGGRRIKKSIKLDMSTIKFCDENLLNRISQLPKMKEFIEKRIAENIQAGMEKYFAISNSELYRYYFHQHLKNQEALHIDNPNFSFLVRYLEPTDNGLPLEMYAFTKDTRWAVHEDTQSAILDHMLGVMDIFDLSVLQSNIVFSMADFAKYIKNLNQHKEIAKQMQELDPDTGNILK